MKLLLAEDEKRMASALVELLRLEKYDVDHVADGASALMALESDVYDAAMDAHRQLHWQTKSSGRCLLNDQKPHESAVGISRR